jgi:hypothetical protein
MIKLLTKEQAGYAIEHEEFDDDVTGAGENVAIVLTQDWCPQWTRMRSWLETLDETANVSVYLLEYNKKDFFEEFLSLKEKKWNNQYVPYIRYYQNGKLIRQTNAVSKEAFLGAFNPS